MRIVIFEKAAAAQAIVVVELWCSHFKSLLQFAVAVAAMHIEFDICEQKYQEAVCKSVGKIAIHSNI